jgi:hypothetical protein
MTSDDFSAGFQPVAGGGPWTTIGGNVSRFISGGTFHGPVYMGIERDLLVAVPIDLNEVERRHMTFVDHPQFAEARVVLEKESAVALLGQPGCGRRTTGTVLLASLGVVLERVVLDAEDFGRQLEIAPRHGYLLDLDENSDQLTAKAGDWISGLAAQLRAMNSYLVVRARGDSWRTLGLSADALRVLRLTAPSAIQVFRSHLTRMTSPQVADAWAQYELVVHNLATASPPDAVRLAGIAAETSAATLPFEQQIGQAIAEYRNWADQLAELFQRTDGPEGAYRRALLLAAASLEGAPAATVFAAADRLAKIVELPREPGGALAGPDASELVDQIQAELRQDRTIRFARPAYGTSVLDHVWSQRPQLHADLREWLIGVSTSGDEDSGMAARSLTGLAIRQQEAGLACMAARRWAAESASRRELAVPGLTEAALSESIGRDVRRQLYDWARTTGAGEATHLTVAAVCAGRLARQYPQMALTRLRHLVVRPNAVVQESVFESLATLAVEPTLYPSVLGEVARWVNEEDSRRSAGLRAFLRLATPGEAGQIAILAPAGQRDRDLLGELWHEALRDDRTDGLADTAAVLASRWLEAAARGEAPRESVLEILAGSCRSSIDVGLLAGIAFAGVGPRDKDPDRWDIGTELVRRTWERDPILTDAPPAAGERS